MRLPQRKIEVDILTSSYRIRGDLLILHSGVIGLLTDPNTSFLEVQEANMGRMHAANTGTGTVPTARIVKKQMVAICLNRREDIGPVATIRGGYTRMLKYPLRITSQMYELEGTFEWPGRFDMSAIMTDGSCEFIPLMDATLGAVLFPSLLIQSPVIIFNRLFINTIVQLDETTRQA